MEGYVLGKHNSIERYLRSTFRKVFDVEIRKLYEIEMVQKSKFNPLKRVKNLEVLTETEFFPFHVSTIFPHFSHSKCKITQILIFSTRNFFFKHDKNTGFKIISISYNFPILVRKISKIW